MKKKYWLILLILIIISVCGLIFFKKSVKNDKVGNNKNSQEIVDYILNLSSYETQITVTVTSNKNSNKYILKQNYQAPNISSQEVIEPSNIAGVKIENDGTNLKIENSSLNINKILENYSYLGNNCLDLSTFISDYKENNESSFEEKDTEIIMNTISNTENIYTHEKTLHIDKNTAKPTQMEIKDNKQNTTIYILYNEVKIK
mgnify:FL=1